VIVASLLVQQSLLQLVVATVASLTVTIGAIAYLRHVRLERPPIGTFNLHDVATLLVFVVVLPVIYLSLPRWALTSFLVLTFTGALSIGLRPILGPGGRWLFIGVLLGANLWVARTMLGTQTGWQLYWILVGACVLGAAISVANLYVQGGMKLQHAALLALGLAFYDFFFGRIVPLTPRLADRFQGYPLNAAVGMRFGIFNAAIGVGDLLAFAIFAAAAYKAYGRRSVAPTMAVVLVFGAVAPSLTPLFLGAFTRGSLNVVVPVQTWFGPPAFVLAAAMRRRFGPERTTADYLRCDDVAEGLRWPKRELPPRPAPAV
jgi:hypothetical protein